MALQTQIAIKL